MNIYLRFTCTILMVGALLLLPDLVFAQDTGAHAENKAELFAEFLDFLSWLRVIPAVVAGKLMTNSFVYGEFIGLTTILWKIWQAMKVFAYITLGFVFLAMIFKHIIKQEDVNKLGDTLKKTIVAGILIQMSRFLIAALIDLSLIATAAVSAIPLQIMDNQWDSLRNEFEISAIVIDADTGKVVPERTTEATTTILTLDDVSPDVDTVAGPLVFLAAAVMRLTDARFIGDDNTTAAAKNKNYEGIIIASGLKLLIVVMFVAPMVVLMIINAVRIFWIWIWILLSPFIILDIVFNGPLQKSEEGHKFKLSTILELIFQPVVVVGLLSLGIIMIVGVLDALLGGEDFQRGSLEDIQVYVQGNNITKVGGGVNPEAYISGEMFKDLGGHVGGFIGEMILALFSIFLLWSLVKAGASFGDMTKEIANKGFEFAEGSMKAIPLPGIGSIASGQKAVTQLKNTKEIYNQKYDKQAEVALGSFYEKLGIKDVNATQGGMSSENELKLKHEMGSVTSDRGKTEKFWSEMRQQIEGSETGYSYKGRVKSSIDKWFDEAGRTYLGIKEGATVENNDQARTFVDNMMRNGVANMESSKGKRGSRKFTSDTTWNSTGRKN